jgi:hypothetical protein
LSGNNTFTGGILLESGTLDVVGAGAGSGAITIVNAAQATLEIDAANGLLNDAIIIDNFTATSETFAAGVLTLTNASGGTLNIDVANAGANFGADLHFAVDAVNGTTTITSSAAAWSNVNGGDWDTAANWNSTAVPTAANDVTIATGAPAPYTISITQGALFIPVVTQSPSISDLQTTNAVAVPAEAEAQAHNLTIDDPNATIDDTGILALSGGLTLTAGTFHLDGGSLQTAASISIADGATFEGDGMVSVGGTVSGTVVASDAGGSALDFVSAVTGNGNFHINAGATLEFDGSVASGATVTFEGGTGELKLDAPGSFAATIAGFTGTQADAAHSDVIDLAGIDETSAHFTESYAGGVLTVSDGTHTAQLTFSNFNSGFKFATDGNGGTLIFDPPAAPAAAVASNAAAGTPAGLGHNFVFHPGMGAETISHFDPGQDTIELDHFANLRTAGQLTQLITSDDHSNAVIELGHDSVTIAGMTPQHLQAVLTSVVHLH